MEEAKDKEYCVYKHTSPSGKVYIGITSKEPFERWRNGHGYHNNKHFRNAIKKYGWDNFKHEILYEGLTKKDACNLEVLLINKYDATNHVKGYNLSRGGNVSWNTGLKMSDEYKISCSSRMKGKFAGKNHPMFGKHHSKHSILKMRMSCADNEGKWIYSRGKHPNSRKIVLLNTGEIFCCLMDAYDKYNVSTTQISRCCKGSNSYGGEFKNELLRWRYLEDYILLSKDEVRHIVNEGRVIRLNDGKIFKNITSASLSVGLKSPSDISRCCSNASNRRTAGKINGEPAKWMYYEDYLKSL